MNQALPADKAAEWRGHWKLVLASAFGFSLTSIAITSFGAYLPSLEEAFGWGRAQISSGLTVYAVLGIFLGPLLGTFVDRWGPRLLAVPGVFLCGAAFALFGTVTSSIIHWLALWVVFSVTAQIPRQLIWSAAVSSEFKASRGLALAFVFGFGALGGVISPIYASTLIDAFGWRGAYAVMGLSWGGIAFLFCYLFFHSRLDTVREPRKETKAEQPVPGYTFQEGLRSPAFIKLVLAVLLGNTLYIGVHVHMVPLLMQTGMPRSEAAWIVGLCILAAVPGQLLCGWLADRIHGPYISAASLAIMALTCALLLIKTDSYVLRIIPVILVSIVGGERAHMVTYLASRYFGLRAFGKIFGVVSSFIAITIGLGPFVAGYVYDQTKSYDLVMMGGIPVAGLAIILTLWLGKYPEHKL